MKDAFKKYASPELRKLVALSQPKQVSYLEKRVATFKAKEGVTRKKMQSHGYWGRSSFYKPGADGKEVGTTYFVPDAAGRRIEESLKRVSSDVSYYSGMLKQASAGLVAVPAKYHARVDFVQPKSVRVKASHGKKSHLRSKAVKKGKRQ